MRLMTLTRAPARLNRFLRRRLAKFTGSSSGIAATEFALLLPVIMTMYFGMLEFSQAIGHDRKGVQLARTLADLVTQSLSVTNADMNTIFGTSAAILAPFEDKDVAMRITSFLIDANGNAFVDWSDVDHRSGGAPFTAYTHCHPANGIIPAALRAPRSSLVQSEVKIRHKPTIGYMLAPTGIEMQENLFMRPRMTAAVSRQGAVTTACPGYVP